MPMNPCPPEVTVSPRKWTSMSSQCANSCVIVLAETGSLRRDVLDSEVGEDDPPPEGHPASISLEQLDLVRGIAQFHRSGEVEPRGPGADAGDLHGTSMAQQRVKRTARMSTFARAPGLNWAAASRICFAQVARIQFLHWAMTIE